MTVLYRKKPLVIEAMQLLWSNWNQMCEHANVGQEDGQSLGTYVDQDGRATSKYPGDFEVEGVSHGARLGLLIPTLEGVMLGVEGDWIIKGVAGELYPCKDAIFQATYEVAT